MEEGARRNERAAVLSAPGIGVPATHATELLALRLQSVAKFPTRAAVDARHVAVATVQGMDYLLTWNLRHIANDYQRPLIAEVCIGAGYRPPVICTPDQRMGGNGDD